MDAEQLASNKFKIANNAVPVLIGRAGGSVTITQREFEDVVARYGGAAKMTIRMERIESPEPGIRVTLVSKPRQGV